MTLAHNMSVITGTAELTRQIRVISFWEVTAVVGGSVCGSILPRDDGGPARQANRGRCICPREIQTLINKSLQIRGLDGRVEDLEAIGAELIRHNQEHVWRHLWVVAGQNP
jgi:hypothetical protein